MLYQVHDWDDAYSNGIHIPGNERFQTFWEARSKSFRDAHRPESIGRGDLFLPDGPPQGLMVFIHGGYWLKGAPAGWSHLAEGALARGWAAILPGYPLAPEVRIRDITRHVAAEISAAAERVPGPIALCGHSAGGHLAARMICTDSSLALDTAARIKSCVPISPITDLRPLMSTQMNDVLKLDLAEAVSESPALLAPRMEIPLTCWVGGMERPEFIRQAKLLANIWAGLGAPTDCVVDPGRHHFNIFEGLTRADSPLLNTVLGA